MYKNLTTENEHAIKRFSHQRRFEIALEILGGDTNGQILDYGTGDGYFLKLLYQKNLSKKLYGFEPAPQMFDELKQMIQEIDHGDNQISIHQSTENLPNNSFDTIICLEVLEHLDRDLQRAALRDMKRLLKKDGLIVISIPIETGFSSLIKNTIRLILNQKHPNATLTNVYKSIFGLPVVRENSPYINSHIGFNYRDLERLFEEEEIKIQRKVFSPFPILGTFGNSQIFYVSSPITNS